MMKKAKLGFNNLSIYPKLTTPGTADTHFPRYPEKVATPAHQHTFPTPCKPHCRAGAHTCTYPLPIIAK